MLRVVPEATNSDPVATLVRHEVDEFKSKKATPKPEIKTPRAPRLTSLLANCTPKSEKHLNLLRGCLSFIGDMESGKIDVQLSPEFVAWLKAAEPEMLKEAYYEAVYLVADQEFRAVDVVALAKQGGVEKKWSREDLISLCAIHQNSIKLLKEYVAIRDAKSGPETKEADGNLENDFKYFKMASEFAKIVKEKDLGLLRDRKVSIAALKRLRIAFLKQAAEHL